jgi:hypothetical protein
MAAPAAPVDGRQIGQNHSAAVRVDGPGAMRSGRPDMRPLTVLIAAAAASAACTVAFAQDRTGAGVPRSHDPPSTTGAAPREPAAPSVGAPNGHRQPTVAPGRPDGGAVVSPYDQEIDRNLTICRGC